LYFQQKNGKFPANLLFNIKFSEIPVNQFNMIVSVKLLFKLIAFTILLTWLGCNSGTTKLLPYQSQLNQTFDLRYGSAVGLPDEQMEISFTKLTESRCPEGVNCIQAGEGIISLVVKVGNQSENLVFSDHRRCHDLGCLG